MLTILHLSDVHFGTYDQNGEQPRITEALIEAVHRDGAVPDLCVFSGDLAHEGSSGQFLTGMNWLKRLIRKDWNTRFVIVPGNHDVQRSATKPILYRSFAKNKQGYAEWRSGASIEQSGLNAYFDFISRAKDQLPLIGTWEGLFGFYAFEKSAPIPFHVIGLNSAFFCCNDDDQGNLVVDTKILNEYLGRAKARNELVIALAHHPIDWLVDWNRKDIERFLSQENGAHLFLHGHLHDMSIKFRANSTGQSLTTLAAGAAYQDTKYSQYFSFYIIDPSRNEVETRAYKYSSNAGEWVQDIEISRTIIARLPNIVRPRRYKEAVDAGSSIEPQAIKKDNSDADGLSNFDRTRAELDARRFRDAAKEVQKRVLTYFEETESIALHSYALKYRIKEVKSILRKMDDRSKKSGNSYDVSKMVDICGFRIITLYQNEIPLIVSQILKTIRLGTDIRDSPFRHLCPVNIDINTSRAENDPLSIIRPIQAVIADSGLKINVASISRETGYSSVHMVVTAHVPKGGDHSIDELKLEIQIRSALEDVWGELDHKLRYGSQRGTVGISWTQHLNVFKGMIDALVQYLDLIKKHSEEAPPTQINKNDSVRTVEQPRFQIERLKELPFTMKEKLNQAYRLWKEADLTFSRGGDAGLLRRAADAFLELLVLFPEEPKDDAVLAEEFISVAQGEAAYLLTYTGDPADWAQAEELYKSIISRRANDGTAYFRLGNVYRRTGSYRESLANLHKSLEIIESGADLRLSKRHWVYDSVRLSIALTQWRVFSSKKGTKDTRSAALVEAIRSSEAVINSPAENRSETRSKAINDYLYYVWEASLDNNVSDVPSINSNKIKLFRDELYANLADLDDNNYQRRDTLLRLYEDSCKEAVPLALGVELSLEKIVLFRNPQLALPERGTIYWIITLSKYLDADEADALAYAQKVLTKCGRELEAGPIEPS